MTSAGSEWTLEFAIEHVPTPERVLVEGDTVIGRKDASQPILHGLDLTPYNGKDFGVSRLHAAIRWQGDNLVIADLHSANGTELNGVLLEPEFEYRLNDGDSLKVGTLNMLVHINETVSWSTIQARRVEFNVHSAPLEGHGQRILVVEDDATFSDLYKATFTRAGYVVQSCREVVSAIKLMNADDFSLVLLDLMLPSIYGLEFCRYVRRDTNNPLLPVVVVSASSEPNIVAQSIEAGADVFMSKPINIHELRRVVGALISRNGNDNPALQTKQLAAQPALTDVSEPPPSNAIVLFVQNHREPIGVILDRQIVLGRRLGANRGQAQLDLEEYGAFDKGVSRNHARLVREDKGVFVEDLGSSNGTFVNGRDIGAHQSYSLSNGDELRLGDLLITVYLLQEAGQSAADQVARQAGD